MQLDHPVAVVLVVLVLLLVVGAGFMSSMSIIFAYIPSARDWMKALMSRLIGRR